jgi:uncharacterized protein (TIGR02246 family)
MTTSDKDSIAAIREFVSHAGEAANSGDVEAEVNRFTEDGIYMWPGAPAIEGHDALRSWFQRRFSETEVDLESESLELQVFGDWAFERGRSVARIRRKGSSEVQTVRGKYINILRRQADGSWRIARRIRNSDHPTERL